MTAPVVVVLGAVMIYLGYTRYARHIDREVIQPDNKKATPARMYMDGVDFMPTSRNVLYGYHFKSIAAAGPIIGPIAPTDRPSVGSDLRFIRSGKPSLANAASGEYTWRDHDAWFSSPYGRRRSAVTVVGKSIANGRFSEGRLGIRGGV
jgi:hypothetical protein